HSLIVYVLIQPTRLLPLHYRLLGYLLSMHYVVVRDGIYIHLKDHGRLIQAKFAQPLRMDFTNPAYGFTIQPHTGATAWMQGGVSFRLETNLSSTLAQQGFQIALDVKKVNQTIRLTPLLGHNRPPGSGCNAVGLMDARHSQRTVFLGSITHEDTAELEHTHARLTTVGVTFNIGQQTRNQAATHHRQLAGNGVQQKIG